MRSPQKRKIHAMTVHETKVNTKIVPEISETPERSEECIVLEEDIYSMMQMYFETAFTILAYRKALCPKRAFKFEKIFGLMVPVFREIQEFPGSQNSEYIKEVSCKFVELIHKNVVDGGAFHVNIKPKKSMVQTVQRYAFQTLGYFDSQECAEDLERINETIADAYSSFSEALFEILTSDLVTVLPTPRLSSWKVSLGIKKEYVELTKKAGLGPMGPFFDDTNTKNFPWGKRPRLSQAKKLPYYFPKGNKPAGFFKKVLKKAEEKAKDSDVLKSCLKELKEKGTCSTDHFKLEQWQYASSSSEDSENDDCKDDNTNLNSKETKKSTESQQKEHGVLYPISSFAPVKGIIINVYRVDYPFEFTPEMLQADKNEEN